jgi:addiction module RelE/StbE family toxin
VQKVKLVWTNEALNKLAEIDEYISQDSTTRAKGFIQNIMKSTSSLTKFPLKGRMVPEFNISEIREIIYKNYRIVYRINKDQIQILTVFEAHRLIRTKEIFK